MAKYIKCDCCGEKIEFGKIAYHHDYDYVYCSADCYINNHAYCDEVNEQFIDYCDCIVYDDATRKVEIKKEMEEHKKAIENLLREFEYLTAQN